ncbi:hypothetical protein ISS42_02265 [Candidatus Shapirobacteria bacterium]|nr:hypothetical protein [Candidatus Shapirobacteria bacterium]
MIKRFFFTKVILTDFFKKVKKVFKKIGWYFVFFIFGFGLIWSKYRTDYLEVIYQNNRLIAHYNGKQIISSVVLSNSNSEKVAIEIQPGVKTPFPGLFNRADFWINGDGQSETISLSGKGINLKDYFKLKRRLLSWTSDLGKQELRQVASRGEYQDFVLEASLRNVVNVKINVGQPGFHFWFRPAWHRDAGVIIDDRQVAAAQSPVGLNGLNLASDLFLSLVLDLIFSLSGWFLLGLCLKQLIGLGIFRFWPLKKTFSTTSYLFLGLFLSIMFLFLLIYIGYYVLEFMPHSQDEVAYLFQGRIFSHGRLYLPSLPESARKFFDHEFILNNGRWFSKYPPGMPLFLALGFWLKIPWLINPLVSFFSAIVLFFLIRKMFDYKTGLLTLLLFIFSPLYLLLGSSFMSHSLGLFFSLVIWWLMMDIFYKKEKSKREIFFLSWLLGACFGFLFLARPANLLVFLPLFLTFCFQKKNWRAVFRKGFYIFLGFLPFFTFFLFYNWRLTDSPWLTPQKLYSPFDTLGFGQRGVSWGLDFNWQHAVANLAFNFYSLKDMLFSFPLLLGLPFIFLSFKSKKRNLNYFLLLFFFSQLAVYFPYHHSGTFLGPRYWSEASWVLIVLVSQGVLYFAQVLVRIKNECWLVFLLLIISGYSILKINYLPFQFQGYNGVNRPPKMKVEKPSVVLVPSKTWQDYGRYFAFQDPLLKEEIIFAKRDMEEKGAEVEEALAPLFQGYQFIYLGED